MVLDAATIPFLVLIVGGFALLVAIANFLFGPAVGPRTVKAIANYRRARTQENHEVWEYLRHSAMFLEGLPHFIRHTWGWGQGQSLPNYGAGGSFPSETPFIAAHMPAICAAVRGADAYYRAYSKLHAALAAHKTLEETLQRVKAIDTQYWEAVEAYARSRWRYRYRLKLRALSALQIPVTEYDRIRGFKTAEGRHNASAA